jgi:hypothetical protein
MTEKYEGQKNSDGKPHGKGKLTKGDMLYEGDVWSLPQPSNTI